MPTVSKHPFASGQVLTLRMRLVFWPMTAQLWTRPVKTARPLRKVVQLDRMPSPTQGKQLQLLRLRISTLDPLLQLRSRDWLKKKMHYLKRAKVCRFDFFIKTANFKQLLSWQAQPFMPLLLAVQLARQLHLTQESVMGPVPVRKCHVTSMKIFKGKIFILCMRLNLISVFLQTPFLFL